MKRSQEIIPSPDNAYLAATRVDGERDRLEYNRRRIAVLGTAALGAVAAALSLNHLTSAERAGKVTDTPKDTSVTEVVVENGANLRSGPYAQDKDFTNSLDKIDLGDSRYVVIPTEDGVHVTENENGTWYGIEADNLTELLDVDVDNDKDGIVWVNEQRASVDSEIDLE